MPVCRKLVFDDEVRKKLGQIREDCGSIPVTSGYGVQTTP